MRSPADDEKFLSQVQLESAPCPSGCPADDELMLQGRDRLHDLPGIYKVMRCRRCGLMRTNPRPTANSIACYYPEDYAPYHIPVPVSSRRKKASAWRQIRTKWQALLGLYDPKALPVQSPGRMLEIGCANGGYLVQAVQEGWTATGIEFSASAVERAKTAGLDVQCLPVEQIQYPPESFDIVVGWMVLEHMHDPVSVLDKIHELLKPGGWFVFSVPDSGSLEFKVFRDQWYALQVPCHMTHFSAKTIRQLLTQKGWSVRNVIWHQNPNNLLQSLRYRALDQGNQSRAQLMQQMIEGKRYRRLHRWMSRLMAITRQSGRMTVWAQKAKG